MVLRACLRSLGLVALGWLGGFHMAHPPSNPLPCAPVCEECADKADVAAAAHGIKASGRAPAAAPPLPPPPPPTSVFGGGGGLVSVAPPPQDPPTPAASHAVMGRIGLSETALEVFDSVDKKMWVGIRCELPTRPPHPFQSQHAETVRRV